MRKLLSLIAVFSLLVACGEKEQLPGEGDKDNPTPAPSEITLSLEQIDAPVAGGEYTLTVTSPTRPSVGTRPDWITIPDGTYNSTTYKITYQVKVSPNADTNERTASIQVSAGSLSKTLVVKQEAAPIPSDAPTAMTLDKHALSVAQAGGSASVIVTAPEKAAVSGVPAWLEVTETEFKNYKMKFTFKAGANDSYEELSATVVITSGSFKDEVVITQAGKEKGPEPLDNDAWKLSESLGLGWNMGNHFDAYYNGSWAGANEGYPNETAWQGSKATKATFTGVKAAGFTSVRIPVSWLKMIGPAPDYKIDETWLSRVYEVAQWAHEAGLNVIVNTHHDENHGVDNDYQWLDIKNAATNATLNETIKTEIKAVWTQIANQFKDCGDWLILEGFNEINDGGWGWSEAFRANPTKQCNILNEWNQVFVDAVRATGGNNSTRWLGVPTYAANPEYEKYMKMPTDAANRLMLSVHFYDPSDYTIGDAQYSDWGHTGKTGLKAEGGDEDHVKSVFGNLYKKYVSRNVPVYVGEFGCSMRAKSNSRAWAFYLYYMEYIVKAAKTYGLPCYLWDNGSEGDGKERHGYINHGTGNYIGNSKEVVDVLVKARFTTDPAYTLQSVYDSAPTF
ncbi:MAG: cellulase family glycosylhydrolase [Bacteroidales bacterium]|nr:cellulase family glycosylhydrolase [Bacteroidales bacterium]